MPRYTIPPNRRLPDDMRRARNAFYLSGGLTIPCPSVYSPRLTPARAYAADQSALALCDHMLTTLFE